MRLLSVELERYRGHRALRVEFDPSLTLIGGPNESGKSTLVEAIHRGLFLKGNTTGQYLQEMQSRTNDGAPQVIVEFEAKGRRYRVTKRFVGPRGATRLSEERGGEWQGEEADERLAHLLHVESPGKGSAATKRSLQHWAHLWTWQGRASSDPTEFATQQRESLLTRLQRTSGRSLLLSDRDARIAEMVADRIKGLIGVRGEWLINSPPGAARSNFEKWDAEWKTAKQAVENLGQHIEELERAQRSLKELAPLREIEAKKLTELEQRLQQGSELQAEVERSRIERDRANSALLEWEKVIATAHQLAEELSLQTQAAAPLDEQLSVLELERQVATQRLDDADGLMRRAEVAVRRSFEKLELVRLREAFREASVTWNRESNRHQEVCDTRAALEAVETQLRHLAPLDEGELEELRQLAQDLAGAEAAAEAMATEVVVVQSEQSVSIGEHRLNAGDSTIVLGETDIWLGSAVHLRLRPGGGMGLREALQKRDDAKCLLETKLERIGVSNLTAAIQLRQNRGSLEAARSSFRTRLEALQADRSEERLRAADSKRLAAEAELQMRFRQQGGQEESPLDNVDDRESIAAQHRLLETQENEARSYRDSVTLAVQKLEEQRERRRAERRQLQLRIEELSTRLTQWSETYGDAESRQAESYRRQQALIDATTAWQASEARLLELDVATAANERARLQRVLRTLESEIAQARECEIRQATLLTSLGENDPYTHLRSMEARRNEAQRDFQAIDRRASGTLLLYQTLNDARRELTDRLIGPFTERIDVYLRTLFGRDCTVELSFANDQFQGLCLSRGALALAAYEFEQLSTGTREQLAAAFRFAMAEVLATDHDGTLPLIFDDAFVNSDPERLERLQQMMDVAASRGLQVIVLSCTPRDYVGLGAKTVQLSSLHRLEGGSASSKSAEDTPERSTSD